MCVGARPVNSWNRWNCARNSSRSRGRTSSTEPRLSRRSTCKPTLNAGASRPSLAASSLPGRFTSRLVLVRMPRRCASRMPRLMAPLAPKSSALTIRNFMRAPRSWRPLPLDQGKCCVETEIIPAHRVLRLRVVFGQKSIKAIAIDLPAMVGEGEAQQVGRETSQIKPRIGLPAEFEAIKIKTAVTAEMNATPIQGAVDRGDGPRPTQRRPFRSSLHAHTQAVHQPGSTRQDAQVDFSARDQGPELLGADACGCFDFRPPASGIGNRLRAADRNLASMQGRERVSGPFRGVEKGLEAGSMGKVLLEA